MASVPSFGVGISVKDSKPLVLLRGAAKSTCVSPGDRACADHDATPANNYFKRNDKLIEVKKKLKENGYVSMPSQTPSDSSSTPQSSAWQVQTKLDRNPFDETIANKSTNAKASDNRTIYFLHLHKAGGTHLCDAAKVNGMNVSQTNCNVQKDQRCCGGNDTLEAQQAFARTTHYDLVANERDMYTAMDTSLYRYVVVLRDSQSRYRSHWKNMCREHNDTTTSFTAWWTRQPDNWTVRKICGSRCMGIAKYGITEELFEYTLNRLRLFEDIMFTERYDETYETFAKHVGWHVPRPEVRSYDPTFPYAQDESDVWDPHMSALDDALYEFAVTLYDGGFEHPPRVGRESRSRIRNYLADGPSKKCSTECCHAECSTY